MELQVNKVGDLPLIYHQLSAYKIGYHLDNHYKTHGNRSNDLSLGQSIEIWLLFILSEHDHRLSYVGPWVEDHACILCELLDIPQLKGSDLSDDYLCQVLERFSQDDPWLSYEVAQNKQLIEVYDWSSISMQVARLDATNIPSYRQASADFQHGYSKQRRSDLPQLKSMLVSLDPFSMPLCSISAAGNQADDVLYVPAIKQAQKSLPSEQMLYIGDTKMGTYSTRDYLAQSDNYYLCPLSQKYYGKAQLRHWVEHAAEKANNIQAIYSTKQGQQTVQHVADVLHVEEQLRQVKETGFTYSEWLIVVKSLDLANRQIYKFHDRLNQAQQVIEERFVIKRGRKTLVDLPKAQQFIDQVLKKYQVQHMFKAHLSIADNKHRGMYPVQCRLVRLEDQIKDYELTCGCRVYATNANTEKLPVDKVVQLYREQYRIEQNFHQLFNKITHLLPIYLSKPSRIKGLIRVLIVALKVANLTQHQLRNKLKHRLKYLTNLVPGNPGRKVFNPTFSLLMRAFKSFEVVLIRSPQLQNQQHIIHPKPLNSIQKNILDLLDIDHGLYSNLFMSKNLL